MRNAFTVLVAAVTIVAIAANTQSLTEDALQARAKLVVALDRALSTDGRCAEIARTPLAELERQDRDTRLKLGKASDGDWRHARWVYETSYTRLQQAGCTFDRR